MFNVDLEGRAVVMVAFRDRSRRQSCESRNVRSTGGVAVIGHLGSGYQMGQVLRKFPGSTAAGIPRPFDSRFIPFSTHPSFEPDVPFSHPSTVIYLVHSSSVQLSSGLTSLASTLPTTASRLILGLRER